MLCTTLRSALRPALLALTLTSAALLSGCAIGTTATPIPATQHLSITGTVHGGQQPVSGARIYIFQANNTGYGNQSVDLTAYNRQNGIVPTSLGATYDSTYGAYYFSTSATGAFSITNDYTCAGTGPVYLLATQGNPGLGVGKSNPALAELAVLGSCANLGVLSPTLQVGITELSTVTGVYALAGYMTAPNAISSNGAASALSQTGINNAAVTALGLVNLATGTPLATTAAGATIPTAKINLLADILAACVNSDATGAPCATLFAAATPTSGTPPTDTVTALLNLAHNPASTPANLTSLYGLATATAPYQPTPATQPTDLTLALTYPELDVTVGSHSYAQVFTQPAVDAAGRIVMNGTSPGTPSLSLRDPQGNVLAKKATLTTQNSNVDFFKPTAITIDPSDRSWFIGSALPAQASAQLYSNIEQDTLGSSGFSSTTYFTTGTDIGYAMASDASGNILQTESQLRDVQIFNSSGTPTQYLLEYYGQVLTGLAISRDGGNVFAASPANGSIVVASRTPESQNGNGTTYDSISTTNLSGPNSLATDHSNNVWVTNATNSTLAKFGTFEVQTPDRSTFYPSLIPNPSAPFSGGGLNFSTGSTGLVPIVMDGASAAWVPNYAGQSISGFSNGGTALSPATTGFATPGCPAQGVAVDGSGNIWVACDNTSHPLIEFLGLATPVATPILPSHFGVRP